jgi:hypothetical protein
MFAATHVHASDEARPEDNSMHITRWLSRLRPAFATRPRRRQSDPAIAEGAALPLGALAVIAVGAADVSVPLDYLPGDAGYISGAEGF